MQPSGGIERVIATLVNKLSKSYAVTILVKDVPISFYTLEKNVTLISLNNELKFNMNNQLSRFFSAFNSLVTNQRALKKFFKNHTFDYFYLAHPLNVLEFHLAKGVCKKDTIVTEHGASDAYNFVYKKIKQKLYKKAKTYVVPTTLDAEIYNKLGLPSQYLPHFRSILPYEQASLLNNKILTVGRFTDVKQHLLLLQIWRKVIDEIDVDDWKLQIVGEGELKTKYLDLIKLNNLDKYIELKQPTTAIENYYKEASFFVLTSKSEGFGMVLLEAISFGLPCISFNCPSGPRDIITKESGFLIEENNLNDFKDKIIALIHNNKLLQQMGNSAYNDSLKWVDDVLLEKWIKIFS